VRLSGVIGGAIFCWCATVAAASSAQAQDSAAITDGLLAQVAGFGGCSSIDSTRPYTDPYFPGVRFFAGQCLLEHGDTARPFVASDSQGVVYVLNSLTGFTFLILRHPAHGVDSTNAVAYVRSAARYLGSLYAGVAFVDTVTAIPDSMWHLTGASPLQVLRPGIYQWVTPSAALVTLLAYDSGAIYFREYLLHLPDGQVTEMTRRDFKAPNQ
jgi:hypothetical protein